MGGGLALCGWKTLQAVRAVGLKDDDDAAGLRAMVEEVVKEMGDNFGNMGLQGLENDDVGEKQKLRVAFVVLLERALGTSLAGKLKEIRKAVMDLIRVSDT